MSSAINGLLRRKNDSASASATSLHDIPDAQSAATDKETSTADDEDDALTATIVQPGIEADVQQTAPNGTSNDIAGTASPQITTSVEPPQATNGTSVVSAEAATDGAETVPDQQEKANSVGEADTK